MTQRVVTAEDVLTRLREHQAALQHAGIRHLSLFGSVARGEAQTGSDIDLAVELDPAAGIGLFGLSALQRQLTEILDHQIDLLSEPVRRPGLQANIDRDRLRAF